MLMKANLLPWVVTESIALSTDVIMVEGPLYDFPDNDTGLPLQIPKIFGYFLNSQKKRSPSIFNDMLFQLWLWCQWQHVFCEKFNTFHGMFWTIHCIVHNYEMAGRILEERKRL